MLKKLALISFLFALLTGCETCSNAIENADIGVRINLKECFDNSETPGDPEPVTESPQPDETNAKD